MMDFLEAVIDDAYGIGELWSITRGEGVTEAEARRRAREALLELERRGYVEFLLEPKAGTWQALSSAETESSRENLSAWGIDTAASSTLTIAATPQGNALLRENNDATNSGS